MITKKENLTGQRNLLIAWDEHYATDIKILDEQHRGIVSIINSLYHSSFDPDVGDFICPTVEMLKGYTKIHFTTEIKMLRESAYPQLQEHQYQHEQLSAELNRFNQSCVDETVDVGQFLAFLMEWFVMHITIEDMAYSKHLLNYFRGKVKR